MFLLWQVVGEAQGTEDSLKAYLKELGSGPRHAHVVKVEKEEVKTTEGESAFEVR